MLRTRVRKYVDETFGEGTYDEVLSGNMILIVNDNEYTPEYLTETNVYIRDNADVKIVDVKELGAEVFGISTDSVHVHKAWHDTSKQQSVQWTNDGGFFRRISGVHASFRMVSGFKLYRINLWF